MTTVYASAGGHRYHRTSNCPAFEMGQNIHDYDCDCWGYCTHGRGWQITETTRSEALAAGKRPCRRCLRDDLGHSEDDFGHQQTSWGGRRICTRCATGPVPEAPDAPDPLPSPDRSVAWPCTTARILGLASQEDQ
ncbi:hypothetical protein [Streptomyces sp. NPDC002467]|uniref:hypothetical protein n=1 Tax=Streptomyces sp. NPDC002467 TaxID=3364647 RepID=UPI0036801773